MDAVTYPNAAVEAFLTDKVVPVKPELTEHKALAERYSVTWTPGLLWLDHAGNAVHRNIGYFEPLEFLAESALGLGHVAALAGDLQIAQTHYERIVAEWPHTFAAPAATYWAGVAAARQDDMETLMEHWRKLLSEYPESAWSMKVEFIND